jgi:hypothetical protein
MRRRPRPPILSRTLGRWENGTSYDEGMYMWGYFARLVRSWINTSPGERVTAVGRAERPSISLSYFDSRADAMKAALAPRVLAVHRTEGKEKWAFLLCPCGCGQQLTLNLMSSHRPVWQLAVRRGKTPSLFPSIDSTTCGAHFWLRNGRVMWSE